MTRRPRPCLQCGALTRNASRCDTHQAEWQARIDAIRGSSTQRGYDSAWRAIAERAVVNHRQVYGDWCPGWHAPAHSVEPPNKLTGDHIVSKARGGASTAANCQVLCRQCNARKRDA